MTVRWRSAVVQPLRVAAATRVRVGPPQVRFERPRVRVEPPQVRFERPRVRVEPPQVRFQRPRVRVSHRRCALSARGCALRAGLVRVEHRPVRVVRGPRLSMRARLGVVTPPTRVARVRRFDRWPITPSLHVRRCVERPRRSAARRERRVDQVLARVVRRSR